MKTKSIVGIVLMLLLTGMLSFTVTIQQVKASGTIYIKADGSIDPPTANITSPDNITYTFTGNINDSIVVERDNIVVDGSGYTLQGPGSGNGFHLNGRNNVTIKNTIVKGWTTGIWTHYSSGNTIDNNTVTSNSIVGIMLCYGSNSNIVSGNTVTSSEAGITTMLYSNNNNIAGNEVTLNGVVGIVAKNYSWHNTISGNNVTSNGEHGIALYDHSGNNTISGNTITNNDLGVSLENSSSNTIYHNNFVNNTVQANVTSGCVNTWDDGYPSGGNYWSNYTDVDSYSGPYQNITGSDGIWDRPYVLDTNNTDRYPLMIPRMKAVIHTVWSEILNVTTSWNNTDPAFRTLPFSGESNVTLSLPDANGARNMTLPKGNGYVRHTYDPITNLTIHPVYISDSYGKLYTIDGVGDVDIISMTNDTGMFFKNWTDGTWHPPAEEWLGDGTPDPAGSAWFTGILNITHYLGNGTHGPFVGSYLSQFWITTGYSENTVDETNSRLNDFCVNATGVPFLPPYVGTIGTYVSTNAHLNTPWRGEHLDVQSKTDQLQVTPKAIMFTLFSPANLYVTDPENRHIGADPTTGEHVNEIPGAFYSGPGSHPQRIVIPDPVDGVYDIKIVGTSTGEYTLVVELATVEETTTNTHTGHIAVGQILESEANISEDEMTFTPPSAPVGGISIPVNKIALLAPYIGPAILLAVAVVAASYAKKRNRQKRD